MIWMGGWRGIEITYASTIATNVMTPATIITNTINDINSPTKGKKQRTGYRRDEKDEIRRKRTQ